MPPSGLEHSDDLLTKLDHAIQRVLDVSGIRYDDPNHPSSPVVVVGWNNWQWTQLPDDAAPLVGAARDALRRVREFASNAARRAPDQRRGAPTPGDPSRAPHRPTERHPPVRGAGIDD